MGTPAKLLQCETPMEWAPERTTKSSTVRPLEAKLSASWVALKNGGGRSLSASASRDIRPSRRPAGSS